MIHTEREVIDNPMLRMPWSLWPITWDSAGETLRDFHVDCTMDEYLNKSITRMLDRPLFLRHFFDAKIWLARNGLRDARDANHEVMWATREASATALKGVLEREVFYKCDGCTHPMLRGEDCWRCR